MKKRILAILLTAAMAVGLAACQTGGGAGSDVKGISVTVGPPTETIDPAMNTTVDGFTYLAHLNEGLMRYKWDGNGVELGLAESAEASADGMTWTFKLREDAKWSDGQAVTAEDFVYSWRRACDPATAAPYGFDMGVYIKNGERVLSEQASTEELGVTAIDERTLEVQLEGPCAYFEEIAAFPFFMPVRKDMVEAHGDRWAVETEAYISAGPYKMLEFKTDENLVVIPNEHYYDKDKLVAQKITFEFLADEVAMLNALQSGNVSYTRQYPTEEKETLAAQNLNGISPLLGTYYVSFNTEAAPFDDVNVRKAFSLAIDRDYMANTLNRGDFLPADALVGPGFNDVEAGTDFREVGASYIGEDYEANKEAARQALADAGYPNGEGFPVIEYLHDDRVQHQMIGEALQNMWQEVLGVKVDLAKQEWKVFPETRRSGNFTIARNGWIADYNDPFAILTIFLTGGGNNDGNFSNPEFDAQMGIASSSNDRAERMNAMHRAEDILLAESWGCAPIMYYAEVFAVEPNLKDWVNSPLGAQFFHRAYYEEA